MGRKKMEPGTTKGDRAALKAEFKRMPRLGPEELSIYGGGSGGLSFVWQTMDHERNSRIATGRTVTMDDARGFLSSTERGQKLVKDGWLLWNGDGGGPMVIAPVERTGPNTIKMGDTEYTYYIDQTDPFYRRDGEVRQASITLTYHQVNEKYDIDVPDREVKNIGTLSQAAFFLTHEKDLMARPPESFLYQVEG
jgi:hypothetical protein